jgi:Ca-activated chloride channel family protein
MIVFDISLSMLAEDIQPNRIETAKAVIRDFIETRTKDRIWLIIFAGKPFISIPFSTDYSGIKSIVKWLSPYLIRQDLPGLSGTNIGDALLLANMTHSGWISTEKSIILLTDWRANIGIDPIIAARESLDSNIKVYTIGIGSLDGGDLFHTDTYGKKIYFYSENGSKLQADLDESMMKKIAKTTHGEYFHAKDKTALEKIFIEIEKKLPKTIEEKTENSTINIIPIFLIAILIILAFERAYLSYLMRKYHLN